MRDEKMKAMSDPIESGRLPSELEADFIDAMAPGAPISEALRAHLDLHPQDAEALACYREIGADVHSDTLSLDPGDHFFESLRAEIVSGLEAPSPGPAEASPAEAPGLLERLSALLTPGRIMAAAAMAAALALAFVFLGDGAPKPASTVAPETAQRSAGQQLETDLSTEELEDLRQIASKMDLNLDDDWDEEVDAPIGTLRLTEQELESIKDSLVEL